MSVKLTSKVETIKKSFDDIKDNVYTLELSVQEIVAIRALIGVATPNTRGANIRHSTALETDVKPIIIDAVKEGVVLNKDEWKGIVREISKIEGFGITK